jgi:predicted TIM-barrel fold metal-dependent hydrolase
MIDHHVHIGQWYERYYTAEKVFDAVFAQGKIDEAWFFSTTNCVNDIKYSAVEKEIAAALKLPYKTTPLLWWRPDFNAQGVSIEKAMRALPYQGFKLHPRANPWNLDDPQVARIAAAVFEYADERAMPIVIHTGPDPFELPTIFSRFFAAAPNAKIILAHARPVEETIPLLYRYPNVCCDTAFVPPEDIKRIQAAGFGGRILFGTDFPITHYWKTRDGSKVSLREQYAEDSKTEVAL